MIDHRTPDASVAVVAPRAADWLQKTKVARVLSAFDRACNLLNEHDEVMALVAPEVGSGPFHGVLDRAFPFRSRMATGSTVVIRGGRIVAGRFHIGLDAAKCWSPRPDWRRLHGAREDVVRQALRLSASQASMSANASGAWLGPEAPWGGLASAPSVQEQGADGARELCEAVARVDLPAALIGSASLAGLGPGSTPSGDDFILGNLYAAWILHSWDTAAAMAKEIAQAVAARTTSLSAAWLHAASRGEAGATWHELFDSLVNADAERMHAAAVRIGRTGVTSGHEALAGFFGALHALAAPGSTFVLP